MEAPFRNGSAAPRPDSLWAAVTPQGVSFPSFSGNARCDIAIVGGGFMGLTAALKLAGQGKNVTILEAVEPGWGASGRNNGLVAPGLKRDPHEVIRILGKSAGERLVGLSGDAPDKLFDLISSLDIHCDVNRNGWIQAAHSRFALKKIIDRMKAWQNRGADVTLIHASEVAGRLGTRYYSGAWLDRRGGSLNPLALVRGLANAATSAGASVFSGSPVVDISRDQSGWKLQLADGALTCEQVLICCNAYGQLPQVRRAVMPLRTAQVASRPLTDTQVQRLLPGGESVSDTQRLLTSFRLTADKRLIMGGATATAGDHHAGLVQRLHQAAAQRFPYLSDIEWEFGWSGYLALTPSHLPAIYTHDAGLYSAIGCNGRGIAMATAIGGLLSDLVGGMDQAACPVPVRQADRYFGYALRVPAVAMAVRWNKAMDAVSRLF